MRLCPWILQAPTMSAAIGTKNKMRTRVERREKGSDRLPPYALVTVLRLTALLFVLYNLYSLLVQIHAKLFVQPAA